jgi:hypothetical protein
VETAFSLNRKNGYISSPSPRSTTGTRRKNGCVRAARMDPGEMRVVSASALIDATATSREDGARNVLSPLRISRARRADIVEHLPEKWVTPMPDRA